ncbi:MAG: Gfo/Idh/MocA family oxidoreductase [Nanoarchaeota archaeon]
MEKVKVAVIGVGAMGKNHARVYSEISAADLVAVCDADEALAKTTACKYNTKFYTNYKEMLRKEKPDAVSICVPTKLHKQVAVDAIKSGIDVLVEKPIAASVEEAKEMINEARKSNVKLMIGHIERFNPVVIELKKKIERNELGKIFKVHCARLSLFPQRIIDVGVTIDLATHEIDILKYLVNSKIIRVYAETAQRLHSTHEDLLIGTLRFENSILGVINANWLTPKKVREITVTGEKGMFVADYLTQELFFYEKEFAKRDLDYKEMVIGAMEGRKMKIRIKRSEPLKNELEAFLECISQNKKPPVTGEEALDVLRIAQKFLESAKRNEVVAL